MENEEKWMNKVVLEGHTQTFIDALAAKGGEPIYKLTPQEARDVLEKVQSQPETLLLATIEEKSIQAGPNGKVTLRIVRPENSTGMLPIVMYYHGGGWILGSSSVFDRLIRELAVGSNSAVVFVNYTRSPEAKYPIAIEEAFAATKFVSVHGHAWNLDTSRISIAGDSVGGNMAIAMTLLAKERQGPKIDCQVLFYPVTDSDFDTPSYQQFANGPWLTKPAMEWFWSAYQPDKAARKTPLMSPLHAPLELLKGLPPALVMTAENDVLRDEGEMYARKLMEANVRTTAVRFLGTIHDFAMLNPISGTPATRAAIALACKALRNKGVL